jgi:probable rRNA maturation factor
MDPDGHRLEVIIVDARGRSLRVAGLSSWLRRIAPPSVRGWVSIALVSDRQIRSLNHRYRGKDCATDVLSFPADAGRGGVREGRPGVGGVDARSRAAGAGARPRPLAEDRRPLVGEIVIARGVARRQARAARHSELTELKVLALHGLLHLLGYDHERDNGRMVRRERALRRRGGLPAGLIERAGAEGSPASSRRPMRRECGVR